MEQQNIQRYMTCSTDRTEQVSELYEHIKDSFQDLLSDLVPAKWCQEPVNPRIERLYARITQLRDHCFDNDSIRRSSAYRYLVTIHPSFWQFKFPEWQSFDQQTKDIKTSEVYKLLEGYVAGKNPAAKELIEAGFYDDENNFIPYIHLDCHNSSLT